MIEAVAGNMGVAVLQPCLFERELAEGRIAMPLPLPVSPGCGAAAPGDRPADAAMAITTMNKNAASVEGSIRKVKKRAAAGPIACVP